MNIIKPNDTKSNTEEIQPVELLNALEGICKGSFKADREEIRNMQRLIAKSSKHFDCPYLFEAIYTHLWWAEECRRKKGIARKLVSLFSGKGN